LQTDNVEPLKP